MTNKDFGQAPRAEGESPSGKTRKIGRPSVGRRAEIMRTVTKTVQENPNMSIRKIAEVAGVAKSTAQQYLTKYGINKHDLDMFVDNRIDIVRSKQQMILDALTPAVVSKAPMRDLAVAYGILLDKDRLESGQSTSNVASWTAVIQRSQSADASKPENKQA